MTRELYEIPGGVDFIEAHPNEFPLISQNEPLENIMRTGDRLRSLGRYPMMIMGSPAMAGWENKWENHADPSGLLNNIPAHIDLLIVDYATDVLDPDTQPVIPSVWSQNKPAPPWLIWESGAEDISRRAFFNGSHQSFVNLFNIDPEQAPPPPPPVITMLPSTAYLSIYIKCPYCNQDIVADLAQEIKDMLSP